VEKTGPEPGNKKDLNESRQFDFEQAFADEFVVMDVLARVVQHMIKKVIEDAMIGLSEKEKD
jgi:aspartyl/asparaginyl-tRNA synthetase